MKLLARPDQTSVMPAPAKSFIPLPRDSIAGAILTSLSTSITANLLIPFTTFVNIALGSIPSFSVIPLINPAIPADFKP